MWHCPHCKANYMLRQRRCNGLLIPMHWCLQVYYSPAVVLVIASDAKVHYNLVLCCLRRAARLQLSQRQAINLFFGAAQWASVLLSYSPQLLRSSPTYLLIQSNVRKRLVCGQQCQVWPLRLDPLLVAHCSSIIGGDLFS